MSKYDVKVGFSGYFFQEYEVTASTEEEARELITTVIQEEGWQEAGAIENITSLGGNSDITDMEITDWDIDEIAEAEEENNHEAK
jgi:uncharacterized ubiquitin-like protein YukD